VRKKKNLYSEELLYLFVKIKNGNEKIHSGNKTENYIDKRKTIKCKSKDLD
jgi:CxxC motif-containing protein